MTRNRSKAGRSLGLVALGGVCGASARYAVAGFVATPAGTALANVLGCLLLGALTADAGRLADVSDRVRLLVATGFVSSLTTYSTFAVETASVAPALGVAYVVLSYGLGFASVVVGRRLAASAGRAVPGAVDR